MTRSRRPFIMLAFADIVTLLLLAVLASLQLDRSPHDGNLLSEPHLVLHVNGELDSDVVDYGLAYRTADGHYRVGPATYPEVDIMRFGMNTLVTVKESSEKLSLTNSRAAIIVYVSDFAGSSRERPESNAEDTSRKLIVWRDNVDAHGTVVTDSVDFRLPISPTIWEFPLRRVVLGEQSLSEVMLRVAIGSTQ